MKVFWAVLGVVLLAVAALVTVRHWRAERDHPSVIATEMGIGASIPTTFPDEPGSVTAAEAPAGRPAPHVPAANEPAAAAPQSQSVAREPRMPGGAPDPRVSSAPAGVAPRADMTGATDATKALLGEDAGSSLDAALGVPSPASAAATAGSAQVAPAAAEARAPEAREGAPARMESRADGSVLIDGKYAMKGSGTENDPYVVTWEQLASVQETYQPRLGRKVIPDRVKMLDGKWVRISGYIAFPVMASSADEMLAMLNQWDGCCIGVPPTPYDAVEIKLRKAVEGPARQKVTGSVRGKFRVDPYLVKDWLVSLYMMDDAELVKVE